ncbi:MAG: malto-oligosyltrehalose trehalohydrolase [Thermovirgaceae bacterium]
MKRPAVWAPNVSSMELITGNGRVSMKMSPGGWWEAPGISLKDGDEYAYSVDGGPWLPDPRSLRQPGGVHGPSAFVDHGMFPWTDDTWQPPPFASAVIYEIHAGTFSPEGTFEDIITRLDHLQSLGVTHLELMPVNGFSGNHGWGYDGVNLYAPHEAYGGPDGLKKLVDAAHEKGIAVVLDVVYNHLGPEGNYLGFFGPYFSKKYASPWGDAINFDGPFSDEVRRFFLDNARMWLADYHIDGLRVDAVHAIFDQLALHFLEELADVVRQVEAETEKHRYVIAESDLNDPRLVRDMEAGGYGLDAQWSDDFHHAVHALVTKEKNGYYGDFGKVAEVVKALEKTFVYDGVYSPFRKRRHGRDAGDVPPERFLGYIQNHDQVGNRALGERLGHLCGRRLQKVAAACMFLSPFVPMLFQGEEWNTSSPFLYFTDHSDEKLGEAVRNGRRREFSGFGWDPADIPDPQEAKTFTRSKIDWAERETSEGRDMLEWYKRLAAFRRTHPALKRGRRNMQVTFDEENRWLMLQRESVLLLCNFGSNPVIVPFPENAGDAVLRLKSQEGVVAGKGSFRLPSESAAVFEVNQPGL